MITKLCVFGLLIIVLILLEDSVLSVAKLRFNHFLSALSKCFERFRLYSTNQESR